MIKVLFVCHGNICRSPMAEFLFKKMVADKGQSKLFEIASAATSQEEIGNGVYPPVYKMLTNMGIDPKAKKARQITKKDLDYYDFIIVMDNNNLRNLDLMFNGYGEEKVHKCLDFSSRMGCDIADPWYTRDFEATYNDLMEGLEAFYNTLVENGMI
ncbi:low molecular weight phosphotyrosine protein phosphatase [Anaerobiospirillum sp. NML120448]|uniref:low molecular weight protein-tyrosine-phosphatase n=1 Tax=Anaerobiospirillum sp. NML120448 TaxID=2932816 RepID=UPI001FF5FCF3|nr:low molecular weight protein-tyrosine-phosphatase [Anaerobiospirillum sp. NML120448]MCK0515366.1 low molecular weight phosphotyrosine protein phosphatase [Anaerobiospirillum sp. NML120448]